MTFKKPFRETCTKCGTRRILNGKIGEEEINPESTVSGYWVYKRTHIQCEKHSWKKYD